MTITQETSTAAQPYVSRHSILLVVLAVVLSQVGPYLHNVMSSWQRDLQQMVLRQQFQVTTVDNFITDDLLDRLQNDELWKACDKITASGTVRFWYYPHKYEPNNIFEEVARRIYLETPFWKEAVSYEYWCNIVDITSDDPRSKETPWHTDRDEDVLEKEQRFVFPLMGAVYYGRNVSYQGGSFQMIDSVPYKQGTRTQNSNDQCHKGMCVTNPDLFVDATTNDALLVETHFNRLLYANVTHFHRVTKVTYGKRYALAVNANHWLPYNVERAPSNEEMLALAEGKLDQRQRTYGLTQNDLQEPLP